MKHNCPYCGAKLGWRLVLSKPLPGERKILPRQAVPVCPSCGGELASNTHWSEILFLGIIGLPVLLGSAVRTNLGKSAFLYAGIFTLAVWIGVTIFFYLRYWRHWQRYKPYAPAEIER